MNKLEKHKFNIFPDMTQEEYEELSDDIKRNGYDKKYPIYLYQNAVLDGWHRYKICEELKIEPTFNTFEGDDYDAVLFVIRTNKRRNLTQYQRSCILVDADELIETIQSQTQKQQREKQAQQERDNKGQFSNRTDKYLS